MSEHIIDDGDGVIVLGGQDWDEIVAAARQGEAGERIVVGGLQRVRPGAPVAPTEVPMEGAPAASASAAAK